MKVRASINRKARVAAFTVLEGLLAVAVMGTVFVSLYTGMASGFQSIRDSQENLRATQILLEKFETIRLYNWEQINAPGFIPPTFTTTYAPTENSRGTLYTGRVTVGPPGNSEVYSSDLRSVRIDLVWKSGRVTHTRSFTSFVAKYGIQNYIY